MSQIELVETVSAVLGACGALLLAHKGRYAGWGFVFFLVSNVGWLMFGSENGHWRFFAQQIVFTGTSLLGVWNWLVAPRMQPRVLAAFDAEPGDPNQ